MTATAPRQQRPLRNVRATRSAPAGAGSRGAALRERPATPTGRAASVRKCRSMSVAPRKGGGDSGGARGTAVLVGATVGLRERGHARCRVRLSADEAGQVPAANIAAAPPPAARRADGRSDAARRADRGLAPSRGGRERLEHALGGAHVTVPRERGVFLPATRRLHPRWRAISELVYDGQLAPHRARPRVHCAAAASLAMMARATATRARQRARRARPRMPSRRPRRHRAWSPSRPLAASATTPRSRLCAPRDELAVARASSRTPPPGRARAAGRSAGTTCSSSRLSRAGARARGRARWRRARRHG